jgi:hypothetical protein
MRTSPPVAVAAFGALLALSAAGCASDPGNQSTTQIRTNARNVKVGGAGTTKVTAFTVDSENLSVDKISMRDGSTSPDGNRDLVFRATVEGPADALYLVSVSDKGEPHYGFRADTVSGKEELPAELGNVVDIGSLTVWIAVVENGRFINGDAGSLGYLPPGPHQLKLYVPNPGNLLAGSFVRLYARAPNGGLAASPVAPY